jgi:hypothetical protein
MCRPSMGKGQVAAMPGSSSEGMPNLAAEEEWEVRDCQSS